MVLMLAEEMEGNHIVRNAGSLWGLSAALG